MTTLGTVASAQKMGEVCIEIPAESPSIFEEQNKWWLVVALTVIVNVFVTWMLIQYSMQRQDDMRRIGWTEQKVTMNGKPQSVYMPVFMKRDDYKGLGEQ